MTSSYDKRPEHEHTPDIGRRGRLFLLALVLVIIGAFVFV